VRKHAQRLLVERKQTDIVDSLIQLVRDQSVDKIGLNVGAIHGLWTLDGLGQFTGKNPDVETALARALIHPSRGVRRNAIQVLPKTAKSTRQLLTLNLLNDPDAQVRLAALLNLCDLPPVQETGPALVDMWKQQSRYQDRWIKDAFTAAAAANDSTFLQSVARFDAADPDLLKTVGVVTEHYARAGDAQELPQLTTQLKNAEPNLLNAV
ncbi:MAG: glycosyl hydrolase, partial [Proteobacteria bacterium]|nr:glycosyl hydrolase [Pseudomonadota bacterium]